MTTGEATAPFDPLTGGPPGRVREELARIRGGCPVHRARPGLGFVGRHDLVRAALLATGTLSNHGNFVLDDAHARQGPELITQSDPPAHTALRALLRPGFTRAAIAGTTPWIRTAVDEILDGLPDGGPAEIVGDLAFPLTSTVIARLVGVPAADAAEITRLSLQISDALPAGFVGTDTWQRIEEYFAAAARERRSRAEPADDLLALLATGRVDGRALDDREVAFHAWQVFVAGLKTTAYTIGSTVQQLLSDRRRWEALVADPALIDSAREEGLRHGTALRGVLRTVTDRGELGGEPLRPGERVLVGLESANMDEGVFGPDTASFVLGRPSARQHVAFGFGIHHCLGAELSRTEISTVLAALVERMPGLALAPGAPAEGVDGPLFHGPRRVDVEW